MATENSFSPINSKEKLKKALDYIAYTVIELGEKVVDRKMKVDTLTIFTHSEKEYAFLDPFIRSYGEESKLSHGLTLYIDCNFQVLGNVIRYLGLRRPDKDRPEVGYGDFPVSDMEDLYAANSDNKFVKKIVSGRGQILMQLKHPDFDVLGYVVDASEH